MMRTALLVVLASCTASVPAMPTVRFANAPPVRAVDDRRDVPEPPRELPVLVELYKFDGQFYRPPLRALELRRPERARGVNALDEVPDSTWFTNRIGTRDISPQELAAAPGGVGSPEGHMPWLIEKSKAGGLTVGFVVRDARGKRFIIKFDKRALPDAETATQVIVGKLMWAFGLNVTEDYVVYIDEGDLVIGPQATIKDTLGRVHRLTRERLARALANVQRSPDGKIRVVASAYLDGKPLGAHPVEGVRKDDPNDRVPHELRRDLRGAYPLFAWIDHDDIQPGNLLDLWVEDPAIRGRHYVKHYWLDYGSSLGLSALKAQEPRTGFEWYFDFGASFINFFTLGIKRQPWERRQVPALTSVGMLETELFDPGTWKSSTAAYVPIYRADRFDSFWGAKIIMRFTREQIRAVVDAGRLSDPKAAQWLTERLIERQRKIGQYWFGRVNPIDELAIDINSTLCFKDLSIFYAFAPARSTSYTLERFDRSGRRLGVTRFGARARGVTCVSAPLDRAGDGYTIARIHTARPSFRGATDVHLARDPSTGIPRVIGIWRL